jgi:hypothetical protein
VKLRQTLIALAVEYLGAAMFDNAGQPCDAPELADKQMCAAAETTTETRSRMISTCYPPFFMSLLIVCARSRLSSKHCSLGCGTLTGEKRMRGHRFSSLQPVRPCIAPVRPILGRALQCSMHCWSPVLLGAAMAFKEWLRQFANPPHPEK